MFLTLLPCSLPAEPHSRKGSVWHHGPAPPFPHLLPTALLLLTPPGTRTAPTSLPSAPSSPSRTSSSPSLLLPPEMAPAKPRALTGPGGRCAEPLLPRSVPLPASTRSVRTGESHRSFPTTCSEMYLTHKDPAL